MSKIICLDSISLSFGNRDCFEGFSTRVPFGSRIAIIGRNGSGKSSLLKIIYKLIEPSSGTVVMPEDFCVGYVEQTIGSYDNLSGGQRLQKRLTEVLSLNPDLLLLDEPTNHLDAENRRSLMRKLQMYDGTLIVVSHDTELLRNCIDTIWHIDQGKVAIFNGGYEDYINECQKNKKSLEKKLASLKQDKKDAQRDLMKEQSRVSKKKKQGQKKVRDKRWMKAVGDLKAMKAESSQGKKLKVIDKKRDATLNELSHVYVAKEITPHFLLSSSSINKKNPIEINNGTIGYSNEKIVIENINMTLEFQDKIAIIGKNASGKSTLLKAICGDKNIVKTGEWYLPEIEEIGYLDQHYSNLNPEQSVIEHLDNIRPDLSTLEARKYLNDYLFRTNEEVNTLVENLSGGEKVRLSLSLIGAKIPRLLILDEITNNLDLETKEHVVQLLKNYPGTLIVVSHEDDFLNAIGVGFRYEIKDSTLLGP